jgi:hypothetical protein
MIVGAGDRTATGFIFSHRFDDKWNHVGEIDGAGVSECLLVNLEIFDGLNKHFVVRINGSCEASGIQQTFLGPSDDVQDVRLFIPPHSPRAEDLPLLGGIPKLKPLR